MKKITDKIVLFCASILLHISAEAQTLVTPSNPDISWFSTSSGVINGINTALIDYEIRQQIYGQLAACAHGATMGTVSPINGVEVTDLTYGTTVSVPYPAGLYDMASVPDVILGNNTQPGHDPYTEFIMAVSFVNNNTPQQIQTDFFDIAYTGPGTFTVTYNVSRYLPYLVGFSTPLGTVHMDVVAEYGNLTAYGKPTCDKFFTTFDATGGGAHDVFAAYGSLNSYNYTVVTTNITDTFHTVDNWQPDVAGIQLKGAGGLPFDAAIFTWANQSNAGIHFMTWRPAPDVTLMTDTYFPSSSVFGLDYFEHPRIDANDDYTSNSNPANSNYKAVFSGYLWSASPVMEAWSFDNVSSASLTPAVQSSAWLATFFPGGTQHLAPAVAFGPFGSGGRQYLLTETADDPTTSPGDFVLMQPVEESNPFAVAWDPTGTVMYNFQVNNTSGSASANDMVPTNFTNAVSTPCNNVTDTSLVAWADYDGISGSYNIWYKRSGYDWSGTGHYYKPTLFGPESAPFEAFYVSPNPSQSAICLPAAGTYQICNMIGQQVLSGIVYGGKHQIDVSSLPPGSYMITFKAEGVKPAKAKFSKI